MAKPLNIIFWCEYADNSYNLWIYSTFRIEYCQRKSLWETFFCSVCGGVIDQAAGTMELPLVSGLYRNNMDCRFVFRQPEGKRVAITFTKFNLQQKAADGRCIDYVEVLRGLLKLFYWFDTVCTKSGFFSEVRKFPTDIISLAGRNLLL